MSIERKLTYVGGGSEKFWQVSQDGCDLHIRYGRIGTTGTTQVKSYGSDDAAQTAADKLVAEKVRKGYVEDTSAGAQAPPAASAPVEAAPVEVLDEDMFTMPATWLRALHPRRGGAQVTAKLPDKDAPEKVAATIEEHREMIVSSLELTTDPEIVEAGTAYLSGQASPLGAAVIAEVMGAYVGWGTSSVFTDLAEAWLVEHGPEFAALAVAELSSLHCGDNYHHTREGMPIRRLTPADEAGPWWRWTRVVLPARVRAALVAVTDTEYADIVAALATCRDRGPRHRAATSFLVPTETAWVEADCAEAAAFLPGLADCLISAVNAPEQAALLAEHVYVWQAASSLALPATVVDGLGTAAVPLLAGWLDGAQAGDPERRVLSVLAELPCDEAMRVMIDRIDRKHTQPALLKAASRFPRRAMRLLAASGGKIAGELLRAHVLAHPDLVDEVLAQTADEAATRRITAISTAAAVTFAPPEALPQVLVSPPWTRRRAVQKATVVEGLACADETAVVWSPQERDLWSKKPSTYRRDSWDQIAARMTEGRHHWSDAKDMFVGGPDAVVRPLLKTYRPTDMWWVSGWLRPTLARFELDALPLAIVCARRQPTQLASALLPFASPEIAVLMAEWLARLKSVRATALSWFARHPDAAARALVPPALGKLGLARRQAEQALSAMAAAGAGDAVTRAAVGYGPAAAAAIADLLSADPLDTLPAKIPAVPEWAEPSILTPVQLRGGAGALPYDQARHVITMLAISRLGDPYAGLAMVKEACDSRSLAEFGWALFQRWQAVGHPSRQSWIMDALALIGDDETVRRLTPLIRIWPGEAAHNRAVTGLDILAALGTEVALMHLHGIAEKVKFSGLKSRAKQKMAEVAAELGLEPQELADRLVPDFGLAADGSLTLDYGARRFVVGFDEQLKPYVVDANGKRLKSLPKPGAKDDADLALAAYQRFAGLKKDVRTVAADTIRRLEHAMVLRRRWSADDFTRLLVNHPLLWHIVRRLVWGSYSSDGRLLTTLRVAEDRSFADVDDETLTPADDAMIGLVHPLELGDTLNAWGEVFADYEILQPFPQLGREVYDPAAAFDPDVYTKIPTGRVLGLERRGWRRGDPQDAGWQYWLERDLPDGGILTVGMEPGVAIGYIEMETEQTLHVSQEGLTGLDPITASEIMRDLQELVR